MNLLEQYIEEVISVKPYNESWTAKFPGKEFVKVELVTNCYGSKEKILRIWTKEEWTEIQEQGYYMG
ncbi:hypothetical protein CPT_Mater98 [Bacillus phage Mater]|uniref:Uncharacterized protein n=1 Tax=Bacillus phage Mater TaxID=1540090 RepID=A0A0A0RMG9_9CAUD|nr:hypothetical protein CPT_Mater98 [Bacillus phage Mater]AIW03255.1 hypothetical protein CPT_Mater98 [Bacillus phage Mater]